MKVCVLILLAALVACAYSASTECASGCAGASGGAHTYCISQCTSCSGHLTCNHNQDKCFCHTGHTTINPN